MDDQVTKTLILTLIARDAGLLPEERQKLIQHINTPGVYDRMVSGPSGAAVAYLIGKFLNLSNKAQILISLAGYGIGNYFKSKADDKAATVKYNNKIKYYDRITN